MSITLHDTNTVRHSPSRRKPWMAVALLFRRAFQRWQRSRAIAALARLNDWQLEDIGVARNDIPRVVEGLLQSEAVPPCSGARDPSPDDCMRQEP